MKNIEWAVIGAGPAGIAAIGQLIDRGITPQSIAWIDPAFAVGDFGTKWREVPSNTRVGLFLDYLEACRSFEYSRCKDEFELQRLDPNQTCFLRVMGEVLQWVTERLVQKVAPIKDTVKYLELKNNLWHIGLSHTEINTKNIILATGAEPKTFSHANIETIPLEIALNTQLLSGYCDETDVVAVFASSHSAVLAIRNILETTQAKKIINFYRAPLKYAVYLDNNEILFDDTGLKGTTAQWARENLHGNCPNKLERVYASPENVEHYLPRCTKAIYAIGFQRREIEIRGVGEIQYNPHNGIIAPGLFGLGIAYPQEKTDRFGNKEYRVGLWKFMDYLTQVMPIWLKYSLGEKSCNRTTQAVS